MPQADGFNTLLFSEVREVSCSDAGRFYRKLDAHITQRRRALPGLVLISEKHSITGESGLLPRRDYVEVIARKTKKGKQVRRDERLCSHLSPAIHADGIEKGRLVKVCADQSCPVHFHQQWQQEKQQAQSKAERVAAKREAKQTLSLRHRPLAEVIKRARASFGCGELRIVACFVLRSLAHDLVCRVARRHSEGNAKEPRDW